MESVAVDVVGEVSHKSGVLHAEHGGGEFGIEVGDELGQTGLAAEGGAGAGWCDSRDR